MILQLTYDPSVCHPVLGAYIRGNSPAEWFAEIQRWDVPPGSLTCMLVPESKSSMAPTGMMVVFNPKHIPPADLIAHPYTIIGKKLLIPIHAKLLPALSSSEMADLLVWEWQVMHPHLGFFGFTTADLVSLGDLLIMPDVIDHSWDMAHPGMPAMAPLRMINVRRKEDDAPLIDMLKSSVDSRPLSEIPMEAPPLKGFKKIKAWLLKTFMRLLGKRGNKEPNSMYQWMQNQLEHLQEKRDRELERLLNMFDENLGEALQYAIPLGSQHASRGVAPPSSSLSKRNTHFSLGNLAGGGGPVDAWDVNRYYEQLHQKYMRAALQAIENKDFKQAAYIYAHLLQDYNLAAKALVQGGFFREAAALYRDYLNRPLPAAECLVQGGLLLEAIEIYKELEMFEIVGDLYVKLEQLDLARNYYRKSVQAAQQQNDLLKAAVILEEKLNAPDEALRILYRGWNGFNRPADHLEQYFDVVTRHTPDQLPLHIRKVYQKSSGEQLTLFLQVMLIVNNKHTATTVKQTTTDLSIHIISDQVKQGNTQHLFLLKQFLPEDKQLPSDLFRYKSMVATQPKKNMNGRRISLPTGITWASMMRHNLQLFVIGINIHSFYLLRISPEFEIEQYSWTLPLVPMYEYIVSGFPETNRLMIYLSADNDLEDQPKILPANQHFKYGMSVSFPNFLQATVVGFVAKIAGAVTQFALNERMMGKTLGIWHFTGDGEMENQYVCTVDGHAIICEDKPSPAPVFQRGEFYYFLLDGNLYSSDDYGNCTRLQSAPSIYLLAAVPMVSTVMYGLTKMGLVTIQMNKQQMSIAGAPVPVSHRVVSMAFIPGGYLVAVGDQLASVFKVEGPVLKLEHEIGLEEEPESVIEGSVRGEFILLGKSKMLTVMDVNKL
jgi:tetratricopeptide (TPR) repeat protein